MKPFQILFILLLFNVHSYSQISLNGLDFDGTSTYVSPFWSPPFYQNLGTNPFTIEAWIRDDAAPGFTEEVILSTRDETGMTSQGFKFCITNDYLSFFASGGGTSIGPPVKDGQCHHVAITRDANGTLIGYVDGVNVGSLMMPSGDLSSTIPMSIGKSNNNVFSNYFNGLLKEIRVWSVARTATEIQNNMNTVITSHPSLWDYYRFNEGSGSSVNNYGINGGQESIYGSVNWNSACNGCALPLVHVTHSGSAVMCSGSVKLLSTYSAPGYSYQWKRNGSNISGANSNTYLVSQTGNYKVVVTNTCGSKTSNTVTITVYNNAPSTPGAITVNNTAKVCPGETRTYSISPVNNATSYLWTLPAGAQITAGINSTSITVLFNNSFTNSDTLRVVARNICGNSPQRKKNIARNNPARPSVINGQNSAVCGLILPYSVTPVSGMTYNWSLAATAGAITNGQGSSAITVSWNNGFGTQPLAVTASNACGTSTARTLSVKALPVKPAVINGPASVCANSTAQYSIAAVPYAVNYFWQGPAGSQISDGSTSGGNTLTTTSTTVSIHFGTAAGKVKVKAQAANCSSPNCTLSVSIPCRNGDPQIITKVTLFPNPFTSDFNVQYDNGENLVLYLYDVLGNANKFPLSTGKTKIPASDLAPGIYLFRILQNDEIIRTGKLVKE